MFIPCIFIVDLFNNPIAQESEYRVYVVHHVPSLQLLDRHGELLVSVETEGSTG